MTRPPDVKEIEKQIETIRAEKEAAMPKVFVGTVNGTMALTQLSMVPQAVLVR